MAEHTPGPWSSSGATVFGGPHYMGPIVAHVPAEFFRELYRGAEIESRYPYPDDETPTRGLNVAHANALLIAAAPAMLEALEQIDLLESGLMEATDDQPIGATIRAIARAAIAQAKGEQP